MLQTTEDILAERGKRYGDFDKHAVIAQALKSVMACTPGWQRLASDQREALEMNAHKIGRILNGDPNYADSWEDIAGYAKLVANRLVTQAAKRQVFKKGDKVLISANLNKKDYARKLGWVSDMDECCGQLGVIHHVENNTAQVKTANGLWWFFASDLTFVPENG